jgi:uncharacterized radical SAM superfamily Fe-S cluster-containing enzyme
LVNGVNNDQVGSFVRFALKTRRSFFCIISPVLVYGPLDEHITPNSVACSNRYTLSHLAQDGCKKQVGMTDPTRDWFPLSLRARFADFADVVHGEDSNGDQVSCGCHPIAASERRGDD